MKKQAFNILMADDDATIRLVVPMILRRMGHTVDAFGDGSEAIVQFDADPSRYDILITDHTMPRVTGMELVGHLRAKGFKGRIIVMSGSLTDDLMHDYLAKRVDKILQKPFTLELFSATLNDLLDQWKDGPGS
jgi:CheY-like chemotaxis protein